VANPVSARGGVPLTSRRWGIFQRAVVKGRWAASAPRRQVPAIREYPLDNQLLGRFLEFTRNGVGRRLTDREVRLAGDAWAQLEHKLQYSHPYIPMHLAIQTHDAEARRKIAARHGPPNPGWVVIGEVARAADSLTSRLTASPNR
jgi:hypothetical protein